ncbi:hypothetical protein O181_022953 [Austropuccinia psidii MF-1]|uniref:Uncharacterized protein n=1 Tax=Austropuccinia psidii MF-1 TaxID=1389203 RepID=A0A9Q3CHW9_9BASI|nr:hypothetical protein [Austropuccinia psidii MF-1]
MKMVHTRRGGNYSVQPDGFGKERTKTRRDQPGRPSSRKTHLEYSSVAPHSLRSVPTTFDINSKPELIQGDFLRDESLPGGRNRNISVPVQKMVQRSQGRGMGNFAKPLEGGHELLRTHQELSGSGEDHTALRKMESLLLQRQGQKNK